MQREAKERTLKYSIQHDKNSEKFFLLIQGRESHLTYERSENQLDLKHTMVAEDDRGKGVAQELVTEALEYAKDNQLKVTPSCSYVARYIDRNPEWQTLVSSQEATPWLKQYRPVVLLSVYSLSGGLLFTLLFQGNLEAINATRSFMHFFMGFFLTGFSFFKLLDLDGFAEAYREYDVISKRYPPYAKAYPFIELGLAVLYLSFLLPPVTYGLTLLVMLLGSLGVVQTVLRKEDVQCACMGTLFDLPMSVVTIIENTTMALMAGMLLLM